MRRRRFFPEHATGAEAPRKQRVFLVDYQMPADPLNIEVVWHLHDPAFGPVMHVQSLGISGGFSDPPRGATIENRLQNLVDVCQPAGGSCLSHHERRDMENDALTGGVHRVNHSFGVGVTTGIKDATAFVDISIADLTRHANSPRGTAITSEASNRVEIVPRDWMEAFFIGL